MGFMGVLLGFSGNKAPPRRLYRSTNGGETWNDITDFFKGQGKPFFFSRFFFVCFFPFFSLNIICLSTGFSVC